LALIKMTAARSSFAARATPSGDGKVLRSIQSIRFVTGVTWIDGEFWHGTWEGDESDV